MTQEPKQLEVIQSDRDAAADLAEWLSAAQAKWENMTTWFVAGAPRAFREGAFDSHEFVQAFAAYRHRLTSQPAVVDVEGVGEILKPWEDHNGPLPEYDHPAACVFDSGVQYAVELLAKELGVGVWTPCDGTEEYDGDLGGTLMNIVLAAMPKDADGDPIYPHDLRALSTPQPETEKLREALLLARSWITHSPECSIHSPIATEDGFREECSCSYSEKVSVIDRAALAEARS